MTTKNAIPLSSVLLCDSEQAVPIWTIFPETREAPAASLTKVVSSVYMSCDTTLPQSTQHLNKVTKLN